jgi:hypothetical protein
MTSRVMAMREIAGPRSGSDDQEDRPSKLRDLMKAVMWIAGASAVGLVLRRIVRPKKIIDVGAVSEEWIAEHRSIATDHLAG